MKNKRDLVILAVSLALIVFSAVMAVSRFSGRLDIWLDMNNILAQTGKKNDIIKLSDF